MVKIYRRRDICETVLWIILNIINNAERACNADSCDAAVIISVGHAGILFLHIKHKKVACWRLISFILQDLGDRLNRAVLIHLED